MKIKQITIAMALLVSSIGIAQKDEMKTLKKIYDKEQPTTKDIAEYKATLLAAEPLMASATDADKMYFNFYKASAPIVDLSSPDAATNPQIAARSLNIANIQNFATAANAVLDFEVKSGKKIYTDDIIETTTSLKPVIQNYAIGLGNQKKYNEASQVLYALYELNKKDVDNLYFASNYAINAQNYEVALKYYNDLKALNYSGEKTLYYATNLANDQEESFPTKAEMTKFVALKTHTKPREENEPSKRGEIYKNIALILVQQGKTEEAKAAVIQARAANPDDKSLTLTEADLYLKLNDVENYKRLISEILAKNPNDADLTYNLGVVAMNGNQLAEAEQYFTRTIAIDPKYTNAYLNMSALKLKSDEKLVEDMNKLGNSAADNKKYDAMKAQRVKLFRETLPFLEKAYELDANNEVVSDNLMSVYRFLEMKDKYEALKAKKK